jgi:hypothetical protein
MQSRRISQTDAVATAADAFVFGYPLVLMGRMCAWMTAPAAPDTVGMRAPMNSLVHARELVAPTICSRPHADTLRSSAWLDLGAGPLLLTVPDTHGRFYAVSMIDLWTNVFASVGARTTGTGPGTFAIGGPRWTTGDGLAPAVIPITAPTRVVRLVASTQVNGDSADADAHAVQDNLRLSPFHGATAEPEAPVEPPAGPAPPVPQVERMEARTYFGQLSRLMRENPPRLEDRLIVDRMRALGLVLDRDDSWDRLKPDVRRAVEHGARRGLERVIGAAESPPGEEVGCWRIRFRPGEYGTDYLSRAGAACAGLEAGPAADELPALVRTDADGHALAGRNRYVLRCPPGRSPPVHGFWSLTTYDDRQPLVDNPVDRYSIGDWNGLAFDRDGSLPIHVQHARPADDMLSNWLPAPPGRFNVLLRLCWPQEEVLDRKWSPPALARVD